MNRISELRKKLGLTQTRLGEEIGVSQQTISKYENVDENILVICCLHYPNSLRSQLIIY